MLKDSYYKFNFVFITLVAVARGHEHHDIQCKDNVDGEDRGEESVFGERRSGSKFIRLCLR